MSNRFGLMTLCAFALISVAGCKVPATPTGVTATTGNAQATISWFAVPGATSYNVYSSQTSPVTTAGAKINVSATDATLSALANGTPVFAAVTAVNSRGESALSSEVCAVPTAASTAGLTMYDPLCGGTLDASKWRTPLSSRSVSGGALELSTQVTNMESRAIRGLSYLTTANVNAAGQRVTTLKADITVPAATASRTGDAELRAGLQLTYQPPANRLVFPGANLDLLTIVVGLEDTGSGLRASRRVLHCDSASCTPFTSTGISFVDPGGFAVSGDRADAPASYDTTYTLTASLNEASGTFSWSIAGGAFGGGVSGTADPGTYLSGNANWTALGANPLAGAGFASATLALRVLDQSPTAGSDGNVNARFRNVQVGFNNAAPTLWDDFSGTGGNSGPAELSAAKWNPPGKNSMALTAGSLAGHAQVTSLSPAGINSFQAIEFSNPTAINTVQADVTVSACSNSLSATNRAGIGGSFYNDGTLGTTPPNTNQPNSRVGDISVSLYLDCFFGLPRFQISRFDTTAGAQTILSNSANQTVPMGPAPFIGSPHTLTLKWDPATHFLTFQVDGVTPVVVDPTTVNAFMNVAAPYVKPENSPGMNLSGFLFVPPAGAPAAPPLLDQTSLVTITNAIDTNFQPGFGQSFTAGITGTLAQVWIVGFGTGPSQPVTMRLCNGAGPCAAPTFVVLPSDQGSYTPDPGPGFRWKELDVSLQNFRVTAGQQYSFQFTNNQNANYQNCGGGYAGGEVFNSQCNGTGDLAFETFVSPGATASMDFRVNNVFTAP